ncbi:MAG: MotA/TolQ/ExbB proton channel family protein [Candidatus Latescibacterota bacterium]|jgi:biopolymer transport protein ExbB
MIEIFKAGGITMWPLLATALTGLAVIFERTITLHRLPSAKSCEKQLKDIEAEFDRTGLEGTAKKVAKGKGVMNYVFARLLKRFDTLAGEKRDLLERRIAAGANVVAVDPVTKFLADKSDMDEFREELLITIDESVKGYVGKYLPALATVGSIATLMGLLGTITGMISAFNSIASSGTGDPKVVAGGISEALITTATGLFIAIPAVVGYRYLAGKADSARSGLELYAISFANTLLAQLEKVK